MNTRTLTTLLATLALVAASASSAQAADSRSFGASNPSSIGSSGLSAGKSAAGWNLKENVKRTAAPPADSASAQDVKSPRDVATGQASGKRMHKPISLVTGQ